MKIVDLQKLVETESWKNDPLFLQWIFDRYCEIVAAGEQQDTQFGTREFWAAIEGEDEEETAQTGGGDEDEDEEKEEDDEEQPTQREHYQFWGPVETEHRKFGLKGSLFTLSWRNLEQTADLDETVRGAFRELIERVFADGPGNPNDLVNVEIDHPALDSPIYVGFSPQEKLTAERLLLLIYKVQQSKRGMRFDSHMRIRFTLIQFPRGGRPTQKHGDFRKWMEQHSNHGGFFVQVKNKDDRCLARAVVTAVAQLQKESSPAALRKYIYMRRGRRDQSDEAQRILEKAGLQLHTGPCGHPEFLKIQRALQPNYSLRIYARDYCNSIIFKGTGGGAPIHLYLHDEHFTVITSIAQFMQRSYVCDQCNLGYNNKQHNCQQNCPNCKHPGRCAVEDEKVHCDDCKLWFKSRECFDKHKQETIVMTNRKRRQVDPVCSRIRRCPRCLAKVDREGKKHTCGFFRCRACSQLVKKGSAINHQMDCYMQPIVGKDKKKPIDDEFLRILQELAAEEEDEEEGEGEEEEDLEVEEETPGKPFDKSFIFYDFETRQSRVLRIDKNDHPIFAHDPILCVAHKVCDKCKSDEAVWQTQTKECENCGKSKYIFKNRDDFCSWLFGGDNKGCIAIAHNAKGFDSHFIFRWLAEQAINPAKKLIMNGTEILTLKACGVTLKDSRCFLPMPLSALPAAFNLEEAAKGYFPYLFDTPEHDDYEGDWPAAKFYCPDSMKPQARDKFLKWHDVVKEKEFNLNEERLRYCESDVDILRRSNMAFRDLFIAETSVDPLKQSITIASACNRVYRTHFLEPDTLALIPPGGYRRAERQSTIAIKWLKWLAHSRGIDIRHARNGQEVKIGSWKVDGYCEATNTVYEFHGCVWHGCPKCYEKRDLKIVGGQTVEDRYQATLDKRRLIMQQGVVYIEIWGCELDQLLLEDTAMRKFFNELGKDLFAPLDPREAFYGGRTCPAWLYYAPQEGEEIRYVDVCSLYPWVCKRGLFPVGHPQILTENFEQLTATSQPYCGLIKCRVLPPRDLVHGVLPSRSPDGKLCFPLCRTCCETSQSARCQHSDSERCLDGAWVSIELYKGLELGYRVLDVREVWHYPQTRQYDGVNDSSGLFVSYVNKFLKLKQQADGWPHWATTEEEKERYLEEYEATEQIKLDPQMIKKNAGLRSLAKLTLNSFWGKFAQRSSLRKSQMITNPRDFFTLLADPTVSVGSVTSLTSESVLVSYAAAETEWEETLPSTNILIACFVTAQARLKLYEEMSKLGRSVLYTDTDSIIYVKKEGGYEVPTGCFLGCWTDEILKDHGPGATIIEYVATAPKSYGFRVRTPTGEIVTHLKSKGFTMDFTTSQVITFETMKRLVDSFVAEIPETVTVSGTSIRREKDHTIVTVTVPKVFRAVFTKRAMIDRYCSNEFGYIQ